MKVLLAGCGKMGGAMLSRWQDLRLCSDVFVIEPHMPQGIAAPNAPALDGLPKDFSPDVVVFAVKPQVLGDMLKDYVPFAQAGAVFLSIAAGKPISFFEEHLGASAKIIRAMPNTPAAIGAGISVACASPHVTAAERDSADKLLRAVGNVLWVQDEKLMDPVTALSGSGPAYVFLLIETMAAAGEKLGLTPDMAQQLARQTVIGSALLAQESADVPAATLRANVTSPGGTTAAALQVLMADDGLQPLFEKALAAAARRAAELSK